MGLYNRYMMHSLYQVKITSDFVLTKHSCILVVEYDYSIAISEAISAKGA